MSCVTDDTIVVYIDTPYSNNDKCDDLDKTHHGYQHNPLRLPFSVLQSIDISILTDVSSHAKYIVKQYGKNTAKCNIFIGVVFLCSFLSIIVKNLYDW